MRAAKKNWRIKTQHLVLQHIMARELSISQIMAQLLINRGIYTVEHARAFFSCELDSLHDPGLLKDLERAAARIGVAVKNGEKILVYGDYDADGVTATALLVRAIRRLGGKVNYRVPDRLSEGYGLHLDALRQARENGVTLVVTVDCGTSSLVEARWTLENGLDLIVTDHHEPPEDLPPAYALVNPKRRDCAYPFKELAGVGVTAVRHLGVGSLGDFHGLYGGELGHDGGGLGGHGLIGALAGAADGLGILVRAALVAGVLGGVLHLGGHRAGQVEVLLELGGGDVEGLANVDVLVELELDLGGGVGVLDLELDLLLAVVAAEGHLGGELAGGDRHGLALALAEAELLQYVHAAVELDLVAAGQEKRHGGYTDIFNLFHLLSISC
jgi:hypothetical protein